MTNEEKLALLNSMKIEETDSDGECLYYAYVEDNEENREVLAKIVTNVEGFVAEYSSDMHGDEPGQIDIQFAAWDYTNANWFDGEKFLYDKKYEGVNI